MSTSSITRIYNRAAEEGWSPTRLDAAVTAARHLQRRDAGGAGKPCGKGHIPANRRCHQGGAGGDDLRKRVIRNIAIGATVVAAAGVGGAGVYGHHLGATPAGRRAAAGLGRDLDQIGNRLLRTAISDPAAAPVTVPIGAGLKAARGAVQLGSNLRRAQRTLATSGDFARGAQALARRKVTTAEARQHYIEQLQNAWASGTKPITVAEARRRAAEVAKVEADIALLRRQAETRAAAARRAAAFEAAVRERRAVRFYGQDRRRRRPAGL